MGLIPVEYTIKKVRKVPERISGANLYVVGEHGHEWGVFFICPCGCGAFVQLRLVPEGDKPCWKLKWEDERVITITPDIQRRGGCDHKFRITKNVAT